MKRILIVGASGMLGSTLLRFFSQDSAYDAFGTVRTLASLHGLEDSLKSRVIHGIDVDAADGLIKVFIDLKPDVVINCVGLVKQLSASSDPVAILPINSIFPHRLARICALSNARLIHMSTDCVFSGMKGNYVEGDIPDARDLYGVSKRLGEVDYANAITLRTSIIGHELNGRRSLIDWFLSQDGEVKGFRRAIFSGLPTVEIGRLIRDYVIKNPSLHGLYHVSANPINKYDLLGLVSEIYQKDIELLIDDELVIDRSLNSARFRSATGYKSPNWPDLIKLMHEFRQTPFKGR